MKSSNQVKSVKMKKHWSKLLCLEDYGDHIRLWLDDNAMPRVFGGIQDFDPIFIPRKSELAILLVGTRRNLAPVFEDHLHKLSQDKSAIRLLKHL